MDGSCTRCCDPLGGPLITFDHFVLYEERGRDMRTIAPTLARRMYSKNARVLFSFNDAEQAAIISKNVTEE
jgi:hypothetical protein